MSYESIFLSKLEAIVMASGGEVPAVSEPANFQQRSLELLDAVAANVGGGGSGLLLGHRPECELSNNAADLTNDIDISPGYAVVRNAATGRQVVALESAITKRLDAAWAAGTNQGGLDTGAIANTTYHVYLIYNPGTSAVDAICSTSASAPALPAGYTHYGWLGAIIRSGGAILRFLQTGRIWQLRTPAADLDKVALGAYANYTLTVPAGIRVRWLGRINPGYPAASSEALLSVIARSPDLPEDAGATVAVSFYGAGTLDVRPESGGDFPLVTNTSRQLAFAKSGPAYLSGSGTTVYTMGWEILRF